MNKESVLEILKTNFGTCGIEVTGHAAKNLAEAIIKTVEDLAALTDNTIDDMVVASVTAAIKPLIKDLDTVVEEKLMDKAFPEE